MIDQILYTKALERSRHFSQCSVSLTLKTWPGVETEQISHCNSIGRMISAYNKKQPLWFPISLVPVFSGHPWISMGQGLLASNLVLLPATAITSNLNPKYCYMASSLPESCHLSCRDGNTILIVNPVRQRTAISELLSDVVTSSLAHYVLVQGLFYLSSWWI